MRAATLVVVAAVFLAGGPDTIRAEVTSIGDSGFTVAHAADTAVNPEAAYHAITASIARWWDSDHSWSGDAENLHMDARLGGCFCEKLPDGGGVEHMRIIYLSPGREIRLAGALGPLQPMGMSGTMTWKITPAGNGSSLEWTYSVHGHLAGGLEGIAPAVDSVIGAQLNRLAEYLGETEERTRPDKGSE